MIAIPFSVRVPLRWLRYTFITALAVFGLAACANAGTPLFMQVEGTGETTIVFISGNGNDSSVWADITPPVRALGVRTAVYDRAGLGKSALSAKPYHIEDEAAALLKTLHANGINGPIVLVAHSYGGLIAALAARENTAVKGMVFVDALLPADLSDDVVAGVLAAYSPRFAALEAAAPALAAAIIPVVKAYPETARTMQTVTIAEDLPFIDITAETTWLTAPADVAHVRKIHRDFVAQSAARSSVFAAGSSHNVMGDRPKLVVDAVTEMVEHVLRD